MAADRGPSPDRKAVTLDAHHGRGGIVMDGLTRRLRRARRSLVVKGRSLTRALSSRFASSLTRRIVFLNLGGLVALAVGFLYVNQFREGLIDARVQSLQTQGEIIAAAISASASVETNAITFDPEKLLQLAPGESTKSPEEQSQSLQFSINPEKIGPVLRRLVLPTRTRARIFDRDGYLLLDSRSFSRRGTIFRSDLPASPSATEDATTLIERTWNAVRGHFGKTEPRHVDDFAGTNGKAFPEVTEALTGSTQNIVRVNAKGDTIISVAVPIQRLRNVQGALLLSTLGGDIDQIIATERWTIVRIFLVSAAIMFLLSLFLAGTIAEPIRKLAEGAYRVRRGIKSRHEIPDFSGRPDEIGYLAGALRDMTKALYTRIEAIERFAADVAHELKNPLTSLRSAVETLPIARTQSAQERLLAIIQHDVKRLDRLISDISDASRLDAELARADNHEVNLNQILEAVVAVANGLATNDVTVTLDMPEEPDVDGHPKPCLVLGYDSRLGQVFNNLVDNARSFSADGGSVRVVMRAANRDGKRDDKAAGAKGAVAVTRAGFEIVIDDDGPGIPADAFERIFERFYTDRPNQGFGQNSGLGLSISRQIVEAHGGQIVATNRTGEAVEEDEPAPVLGARFTVWLPAADHG